MEVVSPNKNTLDLLQDGINQSAKGGLNLAPDGIPVYFMYQYDYVHVRVTRS